MPADRRNVVTNNLQGLLQKGLSGFLIAGILFSHTAEAVVHFELGSDYDLSVNSFNLEIQPQGGSSGITLDPTGNVTVDEDFDVNTSTFFVDKSEGNVGIGVIDPDTALEIFEAGTQLKLSFDGTDNATFAVDTNGDLTVTQSGSAIALGNYTFNVDQTVGAGQDNYILVYDNGTGEIGLEASTGDNLGDHTATTDLVMGTNAITGTTGNIDYANFDVLGASGNTTVGGTLDVTGDFDVNSNFTVTAADGSLDMAGGTIVSTNATFQIDANNGTSGSLYLDGTYGRLQSPDENMQFNARDTGLEFYAGSTVANINASGLQLGAGARVNDIETTITNDDTHLPTSGAVVDYVTANGDNLGDHTATTTLNMGAQNIDGTNFDVVGATGNTTIGGTLGAGASTLSSLTLATGGAVDEIETTITDDDAHIPTSGAVVDYVTANGDNLGDHTATTTLNMGAQNIDGTNFDVIGATGNTTIGGTLAVSGASTTISDGTLSVTEDSATTNGVVDVASINASTAGVVAIGFGAGLTFDLEDSGGVEEQASIDVVFTDVGDTVEDSEFIFSVQENGAITPEVTIAGGGLALETGGAVNEIETTITDDDTHLPTSGAVVDYVTANGDNLGDHTATQELVMGVQNINGTNFDVVGATGNTTIGGTLDVTQATGIDGNFDIGTTRFTVDATTGNTVVLGTLSAGGNFTINTDKFQVIAGTGNTTIDGTLGAGASTLSSLTLTTGATVDEIEATITDDDTHIPTSGAIVDYVGTAVGDGTVFEVGGSLTGIQSKFGSTIADGDFSFAVGSTAEAASNYSIAIGRDVTANNVNSVALGRDSQTNGDNAVAIGTGNNAESFGETVIGLNADDSATPTSTSAFNAADLLFVIGNGSSSGSKSNALAMLKSGDTTINGDWSFNGWLDLGNTDPAVNHSNMVEGSLAYDTSDDELQVYDGSVWQTIGTIGGGSDNLGNHTATTHLNMAGFWIGGDADGSEGMFAATDGDIGIGTATPGQRLDVAKETATTTAVEDIMAITSTTSGTAAAGFGAGLTFVVEDAGDTEEQASIDVSLDDATDAAEDASMVFSINQAGTITETMRIDGTDGFVGIGTTAPTAQLDVTVDSATTSAVVDVATVTASTSGTVANGFGVGLTFDAEDAGDIEEQASIDVVLDDTTNGSEDATMAFSINQGGAITEVLRIDGTDGYIGIDQSAPDVLVDIHHETATTAAVVDLFEIELESSGTPAAGLGTGISFNIEDAGDTEEQARINVEMDAVTNGSEEASITFDVNLTGTMTEVMRVDGTAGRVGIGVTAPTEALDVTGNVKATGTFIPSDERLKTNITTIPNALDKLGQLQGVTFNWIDTEKYNDQEQLGVIAQRVEAVFPQAVKTYEDDSKVVNYPALIAPVIQAVNELKTENEALRAEIEALKAQEGVCLNPF